MPKKNGTMHFRFPQPMLEFCDLARRIQLPEGLIRSDWHQYPNGGGWVQESAFAFPTTFIGPYAIVSGQARILDHARILDEASVTDMAIVGGCAVVEGRAHVGGQARIFGTARVGGDAEVGGVFLVSAGALWTGIHRPLRLPLVMKARGLRSWGTTVV